MKQKHLSTIIALGVIFIFLLLGCASWQNLAGETKLHSYTFNYDGHEYSAVLPKGVPLPPKTATLNPMWFPTWRFLYVIHVSYFEVDKDPISSFWFTKELGVVGLVYHVTIDGKEEHRCYIYVKGLPIKIEMDKFNLAMDGWSRGPK